MGFTGCTDSRALRAALAGFPFGQGPGGGDPATTRQRRHTT